MRVTGPISGWNDAKGFGFVVSKDRRTRAFVHIKAFTAATRRPVNGDVVSFEPVTDGRGRVIAAAVQFHGEPAPATAPPKRAAPRRPRPTRPAAAWWRYALAALWVAGLAVAGWRAHWPHTILIGVVVLSLISFALYRSDKQAAKGGEWRTPEFTLHWVDLLGGWPGGLVAQARYRHKTAKTSFQLAFWFGVVVNAGFVLWLGSADGPAAFGRSLLPF